MSRVGEKTERIFLIIVEYQTNSSDTIVYSKISISLIMAMVYDFSSETSR